MTTFSADDSQTIPKKSKTTRHVIVTVIGATGHQGSGVVAALLRPSSSLKDGSAHTPEYAVRAVTSNPSGSKAQALLSAHPFSAGLTLVQADLANVESLKEAIRGSYGVFFAGPFMPGEGAKAEESEEARWGRNVVDAVKVSSHLTHFFLSPYSFLLHSGATRAGRREQKLIADLRFFFLLLNELCRTTGNA